jgi:5-methyltetrahydrofolate--homocysteine methyltransferase
MTAAMDVFGQRFQANEIFVPEMLISARAMKEATAILEPILAAAGIKPEFTAVIGTISGDLHDIGKNLVGMMLKGRTSRSWTSARTSKPSASPARHVSMGPTSSV